MIIVVSIFALMTYFIIGAVIADRLPLPKSYNLFEPETYDYDWVKIQAIVVFWLPYFVIVIAVHFISLLVNTLISNAAKRGLKLWW